MEKILVDTFIVPQESRSAFLERARKAQGFIKTLPGFVEGFLHEKTEGTSRTNFMSMAVWESEEAFDNAKKAVASEFQRSGFNPQESLKTLKIESERAVCWRTPY
jgi:heme-degrading monooxygenase HmoA